MITKSLLSINLLTYYLSYGLRGLGLYLTLYLISESETFVGFSSFLYYYSVYLILVPLLSLGVGSYLLRYSHSSRQQKQVITLFSLFLVVECLISLGVSVFYLECAIAVAWAAFKSSFISIEAYLISNKKYGKISLVYFIQVVGFAAIALAAFYEKITSVYLLMILLLSLDTISLPFLIINFSFTSMLTALKSKLILKKYARYMLPIVLLSFLMSLFINMDRILIVKAGFEQILSVYGYLLVYMLAIHRFFTTPFIMTIAPNYYRATEDRINSKCIIKGVLFIFCGSFALSAFFYNFQPDKFNVSYICAFTLLVIALYFINLQMLYLKKKLQMNALVQVFIKITISTAAVWMLYLYFFGVTNLQLVVVVNSGVALAFLFKLTKSVDVLYFYLFSAASICFIWASL